MVAALDLTVVAGLLQHNLAMFRSFASSWLPLLLIFLATWSTGEVMSTLPWPKGRGPEERTAYPRTAS